MDEEYDYDSNVELSSRIGVEYVCQNGHVTEVTMAADAEVPLTWTCDDCGEDARQRNSEAVQKEEKKEKSAMDPVYEKLFYRHGVQKVDKQDLDLTKIKKNEELEKMLKERLVEVRKQKLIK